MDYYALADTLMLTMQQLYKANKTKISDSMRGLEMILYYIRYNACSVPSDISREMGLSTARIAAVLNSLEEKGFIAREIDPCDRRRILVKITGDGKAFSERQETRLRETVVGTLRLLGENDAREFIRIIGRFAEIETKFNS
jgi:DNA-binding MarR family transcriptional regulator